MCFQDQIKRILEFLRPVELLATGIKKGFSGMIGPIGFEDKYAQKPDQSEFNWYCQEEKCNFCHRKVERKYMNYHLYLTGDSITVINFRPDLVCMKHRTDEISVGLVCKKCTKMIELSIKAIMERRINIDEIIFLNLFGALDSDFDVINLLELYLPNVLSDIIFSYIDFYKCWWSRIKEDGTI